MTTVEPVHNGADAPAITDERVEQISREFVAMYAERYGEAALLPGARIEIGSLRLEPAIPMGSMRLDRLKLDERPPFPA